MHVYFRLENVMRTSASPLLFVLQCLVLSLYKEQIKIIHFLPGFLSLSECISVYIVMLLLKQSDHFFNFSVISAAVLMYRCQSPCLSLCHIKPVCVLVFTQYLQRHWNFYHQLLEQEISFILLSRN